MKSLFVLCVITLNALLTFAQSLPVAKVQQAYSAEEIAAMSENQLTALAFRAEKLCWFEEVKNSSESTWYTLSDRMGNPVILTDAMVSDFNPLLFNLPQQSNRCENLPVQTDSGKHYLLIVRSDEMMKKEWQRRVVKNSKSSAK